MKGPRNASLTSCPACSAGRKVSHLDCYRPCPGRRWRRYHLKWRCRFHSGSASRNCPSSATNWGLQNLPPDHRSRTPRPPGAPLCAFAKEPPSASAAASAIVGSFMAIPLRMIVNSEMGKPGSRLFRMIQSPRSTAFTKSLNPPAIGYHRVQCKAPLCERVRRPPGPHCIRSSGS